MVVARYRHGQACAADVSRRMTINDTSVPHQSLF
jgi:hypothetical protein